MSVHKASAHTCTHNTIAHSQRATGEIKARFKEDLEPSMTKSESIFSESYVHVQGMNDAFGVFHDIFICL